MVTGSSNLSPVLFIPHGGGPLPVLGDAGHVQLSEFLSDVPKRFQRPSAILVISAHWEQSIATITGAKDPELIYDYFGFPEESYTITYPVSGNPGLAERISSLLKDKQLPVMVDPSRGFDHGLFIPLKLMYPGADIPCVQLSLLGNLSAEEHLKLGAALSALRQENILILGSGLSFHNLPSFFRNIKAGVSEESDDQNLAFESWLYDTLCSGGFASDQQWQRFIDWKQAPGAEYCHPREEHLLPLHVCYGFAHAAQLSANRVFFDKVMGKQVSAYLFQ